MPNLVIACYLWQIEKYGAVFEKDSRMMQGTGPCLQIKFPPGHNRYLSFGTNAKGEKMTITMTQKSGVVHSIFHGYFRTLPTQRPISQHTVVTHVLDVIYV